MSEIQQLLQDWVITSTILEDATDAAMEPLREMQERVKELKQQIREYIEVWGKAESTDAKAWMSDRKSISYDLSLIKEQIPQYAPMVIEETVNKKKVDSLIKGKLVTKAQLEPAEIVKVTKAFYLRRKQSEAK